MRNRRLDVLRGIAILLVLLRHAEHQSRVTAAGWVGVDLFFVLSGFLISGLLFSEYKKRGSIDFKRFLVRRGMKIYPAFYVLLLATLAYQILFHQVSHPGQSLSEMFYVQNYGSSIWGQTWSLAVEEQFYILLSLFFLVMIRYSSNRANPFGTVPLAFLVVAIVCLALRVAAVVGIPVAELGISGSLFTRAYFPTQCRIDAPFFGVLLGYLYHYRPDVLDRIVGLGRRRAVLVALSSLLISTSLFFPLRSKTMLGVGLTAMYLGFGIVLLLCLRVIGVLPSAASNMVQLFGAGFAYVGTYSYSIYLWHEAVESWGPPFMRRFLHITMGIFSGSIFYIVVSVLFGIALSKLVEYPMLKLRDRVFPGAGPESLRVAAIANT